MRCGDGAGPESPIGVLSAVIVDERRPAMTLLGVRRPSELTVRHPNVLSVPTMRLPPGLFALITGDVPGPGTHPVAGAAVPVGRGGRGASDASYAVESLLIAKLGLADAVQDGTLHGRAMPRYLSVEEVGDPLGTGVGQWTAMLTFEVRLDSGVDAIPASTGSYSRLVWVESAKIPQALARHDALLLDESLSAIEVCVQGLCVRVAAELLRAA
jgi:hypothetical protein